MYVTQKKVIKPRKKHNSFYENRYVQKPFAVTLRRKIHERSIFDKNPGLIVFEFTGQPEMLKKSARQGKHDKDLGYRAGWFDITIIYCWEGKASQMAFIEAKWKNGYSDSQKDFMEKVLIPGKIPHTKIEHPLEGFKFLAELGIRT